MFVFHISVLGFRRLCLSLGVRRRDRMKTLPVIFSLALVAVAALPATNLPLIGPVPELASGWKLREQGEYGDSSFQWHWVVFTNTQGDVLSLASHRLQPGEPRDLIYMSDTAHES